MIPGPFRQNDAHATPIPSKPMGGPVL